MHGRLRVPSRRLIHDWRKVIAEKNSSVNAFVCTTPENGQPGGPLHGVGIAIKDNICTADMPTTCSSKMLKGTRSVSSITMANFFCRLYSSFRRYGCTTTSTGRGRYSRENELRRVWNGVCVCKYM